MDEDGYVWYEGRADDVIIAAGYRIGPFEVESACLEHPAVAEAAAVASPDERRGSVVKAFIVLAEGYEPSDETAKAIQQHVRTRLSAYHYPRRVEFVASLPKTLTGKIRRIELREAEARRVRDARRRPRRSRHGDGIRTRDRPSGARPVARRRGSTKQRHRGRRARRHASWSSLVGGGSVQQADGSDRGGATRG